MRTTFTALRPSTGAAATRRPSSENATEDISPLGAGEPARRSPGERHDDRPAVGGYCDMT